MPTFGEPRAATVGVSHSNTVAGNLIGVTEYGGHAAEHAAMGLAGVIARSGAESSVTGTTAETTLGTVTIPGGTMGDDGALRIELMVSYSNNANLKRVKVKFGGVLFGQPADFSTTGMWMGVVRIQNRSAAVQRGPGATAGIATTGQGTTGAISGFTVDTSVDQDIVITGQVYNAADTLRLEGYSIETIK